ncbi:Asparaginase [Popillia japonica]|uniref:Asparaginase n=1 Tax=Popillia japonica TaxID=7064 RepID=A0AAW1K135_POPJA
MNLLKPNRYLSRRGAHSPHQQAIRKDTVLVHGGAGAIPATIMEKKIQGIQEAVREGYITLKETGHALDAVERAIKVMEDNGYFNSGYGSHLTEKGEVEMDASIMDGRELSAGGIFTVRNIRHPITLAKLIMVKTKYVILAGEGAEQFARENGIEKLPDGKLISKMAREFWENNKTRTAGGISEDGSEVGAIVLGKNGDIAVGVSAGGRSGRMSGLSHGASHLGSGIYADNTIGATCCSGAPTAISKMCLAYSITRHLTNMPIMEAIQSELNYMQTELKQQAGVISVSKTGEIGVAFTTPNMVWACQQGRNIQYGTKPDEVLQA